MGMRADVRRRELLRLAQSGPATCACLPGPPKLTGLLVARSDRCKQIVTEEGYIYGCPFLGGDSIRLAFMSRAR
jgi:hypothetical protein